MTIRAHDDSKIDVKDIQSGEWQVEYRNKDAAIKALSELAVQLDRNNRVLHTLARDCGMLMYRLIRALEHLSPHNELTPKARTWLNNHPECSGSIVRSGPCRVELPQRD